MGLFNRKKVPKQDEPAEETREKKKWTRRPANTAFKQQRLKAWQPILTPKTVLPTFFIIGVIFAPIGGVLLWASNKVNEIEIDYTNCEFNAPNDTFANLPSNAYTYHMASSTNSPAAPSWQFTHDAAQTNLSIQNTCLLQFEVPQNLEPPVFLYYKLTNFYQNHRRYVKSIDQDQLKGNFRTAGDLNSGTCKPVDSTDGVPIYPCGLIANSQFNDTLSSPLQLGTADNTTYTMSEKGIAWPGESKKYGKTAYNNTQCIPPPFWINRYPNGYTDQQPIPDLSQDEHFQVWMRTAGLPTFRKLWSRNDNDVLTAGRYQIAINTNFPVAPYDGTKSIVISTVSFIGGRNPFLGIAYLVVAGISILLGILLTLRQLIRPRKIGDLRYLSWNQPDKTK